MTDRACDHGGCGLPARRFINADRCPAHTPAALAGHPEASPDPELTLNGLRLKAGRDPGESSPLSASRLLDDRAIRSGKRRASPARFREARARVDTPPPRP